MQTKPNLSNSFSSARLKKFSSVITHNTSEAMKNNHFQTLLLATQNGTYRMEDTLIILIKFISAFTLDPPTYL